MTTVVEIISFLQTLPQDAQVLLYNLEEDILYPTSPITIEFEEVDEYDAGRSQNLNEDVKVGPAVIFR